jgi:hypothetical protein
VQGAEIFPAQRLRCLKGEHATGEQRPDEDFQMFFLGEIRLYGTETNGWAGGWSGPDNSRVQKQTERQAEHRSQDHSMPPLTESTCPVT